MNQIEKQSIPNVMRFFTVEKSMLECFSFKEPSSGLSHGEKIVP